MAITYPFGELLDGIPDADYHADPALSSTGARMLLPPSTPAHYRWAMDHPRKPKEAFDDGHMVHGMVLGVGAEVVVVEGNRNANAVKAEIARVREQGGVPVKPEQMAVARSAADSVFAHPIAGRLFAEGRAEQSGWWVDPATGITCRFRPDWLTEIPDVGVVAVDFKTTSHELGASIEQFARHVRSYRYHGQADWYLTGLAACGVQAAAWVWVVVELEPPHLVAVHEPHPDDLAKAAERNAYARETFAHCLADDEWPGYPHEITTIQLPRWAS